MKTQEGPVHNENAATKNKAQEPKKESEKTGEEEREKPKNPKPNLLPSAKHKQRRHLTVGGGGAGRGAD